MEFLRLRNMFAKLLVLLFTSLFRDVEKFISRSRFFLQTISMIFSTTSRDEQVLRTVPCKSNGAEERISVAEMNAMMKGPGLEGINISVGAEDVVALFEEEEPSFDEIEETFSVFDVNKDGFIDAGELCRVVSNFKERSCSLDECQRMIAAFDSNGDGVIDFQEFVKFMEKCL